MRYYLDASAALHAVLPGGDRRARTWIDQVVGKGDEVFSSRLIELELARVLRRESLPQTLARPLLDRIGTVTLDDAVLQIASGLEPVLKSLDALHLATALLLGPGVVVVTHDRSMTSAAADLGLDCSDPVAIGTVRRL